MRKENTLNKDTRLLHKYNEVPNTITKKVDLACKEKISAKVENLGILHVYENLITFDKHYKH